MGKKKSSKKAETCGACVNFKKGRCVRRDKKRSADDEACGWFARRK
ncbi:MAG: hypothetical protein JXP72_08990 [Coriobacteriia bacterium]|nr:hypothetical protein [Coriobacteriia bacterium]